MVSWFPSLLPGELYYSACARYKERFGYRDLDVNRDLFSKDRVKVKFISPFGLSELERNVPSVWLPSIENIVRHHSNVPLSVSLIGKDVKAINWQEDIDSERLQRVIRTLEREQQAMGSSYCIECLKEDFKMYGTTYWHREHNAPGVFVCKKHFVFLEYVYMNRSGGLSYQSPPMIDTGEKTPIKAEQNRFNHQLLIMLAEDISLLLEYESIENFRRQVSIAVSTGIRSLNLDYKRNPSVEAVEDLINRTYSEELRLLFGFPVSKFPGKASWCYSLTGNLPNLSVHQMLLALYSLGLRPNTSANHHSEKALGFFSEDSFLLDGGSYNDSILPISKLINGTCSEQISVPSEIRNRLYVYALSKQSSSRITKRLMSLESFSTYMKDCFSADLNSALNSLINSNERVTQYGVAIRLGISLHKLKERISLDQRLYDTLEDALETKLDFAKRKIRMKAEELTESGESLTPTRLMKETNTHVHYKILKDYIRECIEKFRG